MMDNGKRRSSILKSQPPATVMGTIWNSDEIAGSGPMARRRVSFSAVRTVKEFDDDCNAVMSLHDEPIKLGDTGSSDGLGTTHSSNVGDTTMNTAGELEHTANFFPQTTSTPMPRNGLSAPEEVNNESNITTLSDFTARIFEQATHRGRDELGEAPMDISEATLTTIDVKKTIVSELSCTDVSNTTLTNNTRALFSISPPIMRREEGFKHNLMCAVVSACAPGQLDDEIECMRDSVTNEVKSTPDSLVDQHDQLQPKSNVIVLRLRLLKELSMGGSAAGLEVTVEPTATMALFAPHSRDEAADDEYSEKSFEDVKKNESAVGDKSLQGQHIEETTFLQTDDGISFIDESRSAMSFVDESRDFMFEEIATEQLQRAELKTCGSTIIADEICDAGDTLPQQIEALHVDPSQTYLGMIRAAGSPMAVVKKKTRLESPAKLNFSSIPVHDVQTQPAGSLSPRRCADTEQKAMQSAETPKTGTPAMTPVCTPEQVSQVLMVARRRLRRSLDKQPPPLDTSRLSDIVVPDAALYSISYDFEANDPQTMKEQMMQSEMERTQETTEQLDCTLINEIGDGVAISNPLIASFSKNYASLDFDPHIITMGCFRLNHWDSDIVKRIKQTALTGTRRLVELVIDRMKETILNRSEESMTRSSNVFMLANLQNLNPRMMSRRESHVFEMARLDAQREWFVLRSEVLAGALRKTEEIVARESLLCEQKMKMLEMIKEYQKSKYEEGSINNELAQLEQFKSTVAEKGNGKDLETLKSELRAAKGEKKRQYLDNMDLDTERLKLQLEASRQEAEKSTYLTSMLQEREQLRRQKREEWSKRVKELLRRSEEMRP